MSTRQRYAIPVDADEWAVPGNFDTVFKWEYQEGSDALRKLYEKGKNLQWNTTTRIDWSQDLDPENPQELPDECISIFGSDLWNRLTARSAPTCGGICRRGRSRNFCMASKAH